MLHFLSFLLCSERLDYSYENNSCDEDKMCGHYTQMVWADTHGVGCAVHFCNTIENLDWNNVSYLVCNYFPAGNYDDERPYVEGDWCSRCPEDLDVCQNHLCVKRQVGDTDEELMTTDSPLMTDIVTAASNPPSVHDSFADVTPTIFEKESDDTPSPWSAMETVSSPGLQPTPLGEEEDSEPTNLDEEKQRKESVHRQEKTQKILEPARTSAAPVLAASFLLACLTGLLTLDL
uniref:SCP domain-containing protein n=1 Tax=Oryzias sinensis TaxID=183150 RepID=A0A8C7YQ30_9TELE